eukprot:373325-Prymnesium_polylepis.3
MRECAHRQLCIRAHTTRHSLAVVERMVEPRHQAVAVRVRDHLPCVRHAEAWSREQLPRQLLDPLDACVAFLDHLGIHQQRRRALQLGAVIRAARCRRRHLKQARRVGKVVLVESVAGCQARRDSALTGAQIQRTIFERGLHALVLRSLFCRLTCVRLLRRHRTSGSGCLRRHPEVQEQRLWLSVAVVHLHAVHAHHGKLGGA